MADVSCHLPHGLAVSQLNNSREARSKHHTLAPDTHYPMTVRVATFSQRADSKEKLQFIHKLFCPYDSEGQLSVL